MALRETPEDAAEPMPDDWQPTPEVAMTVATVARRLGVAPATLRTWDRRYGLGPSHRSAGSHRRYTTHDVARLVLMRRLTVQGLSPAEAARVARGATTPESVSVGDLPAPPPVHDDANVSEIIVHAALAGDHLDCQLRVLASRGQRDLLTWWLEVIQPARRYLAAGPVVSTPGSDPGAVLDNAVLSVLAEFRLARKIPSTLPVQVLVIPPTGERLTLTSHGLAAALEEAGAGVRVVVDGPDRAGLDALLTDFRPAAVLMHSKSLRPDLGAMAEVHDAHPQTEIFLAVRRGADADMLWAGNVHHVRSLAGAMHEVLATVAPQTAGLVYQLPPSGQEEPSADHDDPSLTH